MGKQTLFPSKELSRIFSQSERIAELLSVDNSVVVQKPAQEIKYFG